MPRTTSASRRCTTPTSTGSSPSTRSLDLALGELVEESAVALVEWGEIAASVFGRDVMTIDFLVDDDDGADPRRRRDAGRTRAATRWTVGES